MSIAFHPEQMNGTLQVVPLDVDQFDKMIEAGIVPEGELIELLDGVMIRKDRGHLGEDTMTAGDDHVWCIEQLMDLRPAIKALGCSIRIQAPAKLPPESMPEPDALIVVGSIDDYRKRKPGPADISCAIEVSDSSLRRDRTVKMAIYARHGIQQYVIINLQDLVLEVYTMPQPDLERYERMAKRAIGEDVELQLPGNQIFAVSVARLLPSSL